MSLMPDLRSRRRVRLMWLVRDSIAAQVQLILAAVRSSTSFTGETCHHQKGIQRATAVWIWHSVRSGFFPPELLPHPRQEQVADAAQNQVAFEPLVAPAFVLVQADLGLLVLKAAFDTPSRERDQQHRLDRGSRRCVAHEELQLRGVQDVAGDNQVQRRARQASGVDGVKPQVFDLPDHRALLPVLDPPADPGLVGQSVLVEHHIYTLRRRAAARQPRSLAAASPAVLAVFPGHDPRRLEPAHEVPRHLADELLLASRQFPQELGLATVAFIERHPIEVQAVARGAVVEFQGDLPLGPVNHVVGDAGLAAPRAVVGLTPTAWILSVYKSPRAIRPLRGSTSTASPAEEFTCGLAVVTLFEPVTSGVDPTGQYAVPNGNEGIDLQNSMNNTIGGPNASDGDLISGNNGPGVHLDSDSCNNTLLENNTIGTDATGNEALANNRDGILVTDNSFNDQFLNNLISGNNGDGIAVYSGDATNTLIQGNLIGTDRAGDAPIANGMGVEVGGAPATRILNNVISGNNETAVNIDYTSAVHCVVQGNLIGVAKDGVHALGNIGSGVSINGASNELIGGTVAGQGNIIAYNGLIENHGGVIVATASVGVSLEGNAIDSNFGLGIDLGADGVTLNTPGGPHSGANDLQNYPVLTSAQLSGGSTVVAGSLNSTPNMTFRLEFFGNPGVDPSGHGSGRIYLGAANVTTDGSGNATFSATLSTSVPAGYFVAATATSATGDTSVFSTDVRIPVPLTGPGWSGGTFVVTTTADSGAGSLRQAITSADASGGGSITFAIPGISVHTIEPSSPLPVITAPVTIDGTSQPGYSGTPLIELNGGTIPLGADGLQAVGASLTVKGLDVDDFKNFGIDLENALGSVIQACYIGVDPTGSMEATNRSYGINISGSNDVTIGGASAAAGNLISGNSEGVRVANASNDCLIQNNLIGTDASGTEPVPNSVGVEFSDAARIKILGNLISGNTGNGVYTYNGADSAEALIQNSLIGTDKNGIGSLPNGLGIALSRESTRGAQILGNVISANQGQGIVLDGQTTTGTVIQGNLIGVAKDGVHALGNSDESIEMNEDLGTKSGASDALIGGTGVGQGNIIAYNARVFTNGGINVDSASTGIAITEGNSIYGNFGVGIDLGGNGVTTNSPGGPHTGPNNLQNFPVLTSALATASGATVTGTLNSAPNTTYRVEFFANPGVDPTGYGQARLYLGFLNVTTDGTGNVSFTAR